MGHAGGHERREDQRADRAGRRQAGPVRGALPRPGRGGGGRRGFEWFELLRPLEGTDQYLVYTRWRSEADYEAWQTSQDFARAHDGGGRHPGARRGAPGPTSGPTRWSSPGGAAVNQQNRARPRPPVGRLPARSPPAAARRAAGSGPGRRHVPGAVPIAGGSHDRHARRQPYLLAHVHRGRAGGGGGRAAPAGRRARSSCWPTPASAGTSPTPCSSPATAPGEGWYDARLTAYAPLQLDPSDGRAALRAVDLRGPQGLRPARRQRGDVPARGRTPPASPAARAAWPCRRCPSEAFLAAVDALVDADRDWVPTGPDQTLYIRPYQLAVEPFLGVRPAHGVPVPGHRQPGRRLLPARRPARVGLPLRGLHPGRPRRHRRRQVRRQLRRQPAGPGAGHRGRLRPGGLARRGREAVRRGDGRDEPVLRPRLRRRRRAGHPRAHRHPAARHHPRLADHRGPRDGPPGHRAPVHRRGVAAPASPTARSPRPSPAAPPR